MVHFHTIGSLDMVVKSLLPLLALAGSVFAHGTMRDIEIDGTKYRTFDARVDGYFQNLKSIEWSYNNPPFAGQGPVTDVLSPDITCQRQAKPPALRAKARAGSKVVFQWTPYYTLHKGPVMTYLGLQETPDQAPQKVKFFKIHEDAYDPKTATWGSDNLVKQNGSWPVQLPSDIKPGNYILRNELLALHASGLLDTGAGGPSGAQFYPVCFNVEIIGDGSVVPDGQTIPGAYKPDDPGIKMNIYYGPNKYASPGPALYKGRYDAPKGEPPIVTETGAISKDQEKQYHTAQRVMDVFSEWTSSQGNAVTPGGGGIHWEEGGSPETGTNVPINQGINPLEAAKAEDFVTLITDMVKAYNEGMSGA